MTWLACGEKFFPDDKRSPELVREGTLTRSWSVQGASLGRGIQGRPRPAMQMQQQVVFGSLGPLAVSKGQLNLWY